jgi:hypothetical protein
MDDMIKSDKILNNTIDMKKDEIMGRVYKVGDYKRYNYSDRMDLNLRDNIVCFFDGLNWLVIKLVHMLKCPILYFKFWSEKYKTYYINSLLVCPITLRAIIYKGEINIIDIKDKNLFLLNNETGDKYFMDMPFTGYKTKDGKEKKIKSQIKRHPVVVSQLREIYSMASDFKFIDINKQKYDNIFSKEYYSSHYDLDDKYIDTVFHPKTLMYIVQYYSHSDKKYIFQVIIPNSIDTENKGGYKYKSDGYLKYFKKNEEKHKERKSYIYSILWNTIDDYYENYKIIKL